MLRIYLLGDPRVFDGDEPIPLPTPGKALILWAYLLLKRQQPIPREHLAYLLWPDVPEAEARANLRRHLYLLRQQLPASPQDTPWLLTTRNTVQWNPQAACWLDVACLEAFDGATAGEAQWAALVDECQGELLAGTYDDWVLAERASLHQRYLHLLEQRIAQQKASGDLPGAIRTTHRLLAHDPWREEPYRYLMELYYRAGDRAAALREFERCETMLRSELAAEPMPETLALRDSIRRGESLAPLPQPAPAPPARPTQEGPLAVPPAAADQPSPAPAERRPALKGWLIAGAFLLGLVILAGALWAAGLLPLDLDRELATTSVFGPDAVHDTWLNEQTPDLPYDPAYSEDLYAVYPQVHLQYFNYPYDRVLIRFDLRTLPPGATVERAILSLHFETFLNENLPEPLPATISAFRLLLPWQQDTATFNAPWSQPGLASGLDYDPQPLGSQAILGSDWASIDVSEAVRAWLAHPDENWGLVLMITEAPQGAHYWVDTTDYPLSDRQPRLDVTYSP